MDMLLIAMVSQMGLFLVVLFLAHRLQRVDQTLRELRVEAPERTNQHPSGASSRLIMVVISFVCCAGFFSTLAVYKLNEGARESSQLRRQLEESLRPDSSAN